MKFSFLKLIQRVDTFGHNVTLNYKGRETYNSKFGGVMTILVFGLTLTLAVRAFIEIFWMEDPSLTNYEKPLSLADKGDLGTITGNEYDFIFALVIEIENINTKEEAYGLPPEVGAFRVIQQLNHVYAEDEKQIIDLVDCQKIIEPEVIATAIVKFIDTFDAGDTLCIKPSDFVISNFVGGLRDGINDLKIEFIQCEDSSDCLDEE